MSNLFGNALASALRGLQQEIVAWSYFLREESYTLNATHQD